ncbi:MAG: hypothetical protein E7140_05710 [Rikenellaceae bacterium]|nr:hypothetical protein [Rikenellaceae bacterium]
MKKMMKLLTIVAAAAMGLTACQNGFEENDVNGVVKGSVVVKFVSEEARTSVDTSGDTPLFAWGEEETFAVLEQTDALAEATSVAYTKVDGKANIDAEFALNAGKEEYKYVAVYPEAGFVSAENINEAVLALPSEQSAVAGSYDPNADLMVSMPVATTEQPTESQQLRFTRLAAVAEMSINNLTLAAGEEVESVEFTANGKALAGTITADLENPHEFTVKEGVSSVSVATTSANKVYFTVLPTSLAAEDAYSVVVVTNKSIYIKQGAIPEGKSLAFEAGKVSRFGVNMTDALSGAKWKLVRDASALKQNDVVTIVAKNYNYVIGKPSTSVYPLASETEVVKAGSYIYHKPADETANHMMQTYTLMQRDATLNLFDFYNGVDFEGDTSVGFAQATGSNNTPKLQAFCDNSTLFEVGIADGVATITASKISGSYKYWRYYHANYATSRKFDLTYSAVTNDANKILLYRLEGAVGEIPLVKANVTVPSSTTSIVITEDGVAEATAIEEVVFNYVGDWKIAVSDNAEWLNVVYDEENNCLKYTAEANVNAKRDAVVTITASLEGQESLTWTFNMLQKGAPEEVSIADFITKAVDVNVTYKLTGKIVTIPDSATDYFVLEDADENQAKVRYLKTESGEDVKGNVDVREGDVITVTTVVTNKTGQGGNSTYPSYYKGYYRLSASVEPSLIGYEGGQATINIAAEGNLQPADAIIKGETAEVYDFVTFSHSDNATTATATFAENNGSSREAVFNFTYGWTSTSVKVSQQNHPSVKVGWFLVTDASELKAGDKIIIAAKDSDVALAVGSSTTSTTTLPSVAVSKTGNTLSNVSDSVTQFTLTSGLQEGEYSFNFLKGTTEYYLCAPNTNAQLKIKSGALVYYGSWTISIDANTGEATVDTIYGTTTPTAKRMRYNGTSTKFITNKTNVEASTNNAAISLYKYYN